MKRPLMQQGIGQLEAMFSKSKTDPAMLRQLEDELQFRQVPRAVALMSEVQAVLRLAPPTPSALPIHVRMPLPSTEPMPQFPATERQPDLWTPPLEPVTRPAVAPPVPSTSPPAGTPALVPPLSTEEALKLLKTTLGASWESIERTRSQLVQLSSPTRTAELPLDKRAQLLLEARRVNAAYLKLLGQRVGRA